MEVERSTRTAIGLSVIILALLVSSCATAPEEPVAGAAAVEKAPPEAGDAAAGGGEDLSAALAEEAAQAKQEAVTAAEAEKSLQQPVVEQEPPKSETAAIPAAEPARQTEAAEPRVIEKVVTAEAVAPDAPVGEVPASHNTFNITAGQKDPTHPFYGIGSKLGFSANGIQGKELIFVRGQSYTFKVDTGVQHDFYLSTSKVGWGAATYSEGVSGNFTYNGIVTITPTGSTPSELYYACRNHKNMGGAIHVVNEGEEGKVVLDADRKTDKKPDGQVAVKPLDKSRVKQKIAFAEMFINQSQAAKRITGSGNPAANEMYQSAREKFLNSKDAFAKDEYEQALALVDESLRLMSDASRRVPSQTQAEAEQARFKEMMEGTRTFADSYQRNYKRLSKQKSRKDLVMLDLDEINTTISKAQQLADGDNYSEAIGLLTRTQTTLTNALTDMLDEETMSYELVFETPKEEFEYELARYESYEELIPVAIEQKRPPPGTVNLMNQFVEKAREIKDQAIPTAATGDYKTAILMLQGATSRIRRALQVVGVR